MKRKKRFMAMEKRRRAALVTLTVSALVFLVVCPLPLRVDGNAVVAPVRRANVQPEVEGVVSKVFVREGEHVTQGQVLAEMNAWQYRAALAEAEASYQTAQLQMNRSLAANNGTEAGMQRVQSDYWKAEVERARELLDKTKLRSPVSGIVATPHIENSVGSRLGLGDSFAEIVDASQVVVNIAVDDTDSGLLRQGQPAVVKLNSDALRTFRGDVLVVSPSGETQAGASVFYARVSVPNEDQALRTGMEGRGKVNVGWYPAGYVFFRRPAIWIYSQAWSWLGW
ncbi:MAG: efflux RND transporter periplasmic adaptor subunit [Acidobacteria bacterium]|nr:efflux RND transporter periplasmic adaptor subunit [Acidobacteriota bacterium]